VSQFVIPAKSRGAGCEPGSRMIRYDTIFLDSGSRPESLGSPGMTGSSNCDTASKDPALIISGRDVK
jgi:hypothetical protein